MNLYLHCYYIPFWILNLLLPPPHTHFLEVCKSFLCSQSSEMWWFVLGQLFTMKTDFLQFCDIFLYSSYVFSSVSSLWNSPLWFLNLLDLPYYLVSFFLSTVPLSSCSWVFPQLLLFFHFCDHIFNFQELFLDLWVLVLVSLLTFCLRIWFF